MIWLNVEVFQIDAGTTEEGGVVVKKEREPNCCTVDLSKLGLCQAAGKAVADHPGCGHHIG